MFLLGCSAVSLLLFCLMTSDVKRSSEMLVLSRKKNQSVQLEVAGIGIINVTVTDIGHDRVKIGVDAPRDTVRIMRPEVLERIKGFQEIPDVEPATVS
jgi:carbon storage regulator CsrA